MKDRKDFAKTIHDLMEKIPEHIKAKDRLRYQGMFLESLNSVGQNLSKIASESRENFENKVNKRLKKFEEHCQNCKEKISSKSYSTPNELLAEKRKLKKLIEKIQAYTLNPEKAFLDEINELAEKKFEKMVGKILKCKMEFLLNLLFLAEYKPELNFEKIADLYLTMCDIKVILNETIENILKNKGLTDMLAVKEIEVKRTYIDGFLINQREVKNGKYKYKRWYGTKRIDGKLKHVYIGNDLSQAQEKILAWKKRFAQNKLRKDESNKR